MTVINILLALDIIGVIILICIDFRGWRGMGMGDRWLLIGLTGILLVLFYFFIIRELWIIVSRWLKYKRGEVIVEKGSFKDLF